VTRPSAIHCWSGPWKKLPQLGGVRRRATDVGVRADQFRRHASARRLSRAIERVAQACGLKASAMCQARQLASVFANNASLSSRSSVHGRQRAKPGAVRIEHEVGGLSQRWLR